MYQHAFELPVDIRNCFDDRDIEVFLKSYNSVNPKTPQEHVLALQKAFEDCAELPSSFSFHAVASVDAIDKDREKVNVDTIKKHMDAYILYGGNVNWEHRDLVTGKVWKWAPITVKGRPGVQIWGNLYGGRDIYDNIRKSFASGKNGFSLGGQADPVGYKCDADGCYIRRNVTNIYEISITANPANPYARPIDYSEGRFAKSSGDGIDLEIESYTIHRDYTTCPILSVKHRLSEQGYVGLHATKDGVFMPTTWNDDLLTTLVGTDGYVLQKCEGGVIVQDRAWATERAFKQGFSEGWMLPDGSLTKSVPKDTFSDLYSKGLICVDPDTGSARLDTTVIY